LWRKDMYKLEILEKKRLEKGLSYTEIADNLGIHKVTVSRTLRGMSMKPRTVKRLADYLGVEMERILQLILVTTLLGIAWSESFVMELEKVKFI
jgi:transcriptional regulator with XRE-family HTH domain